MTTRFSAYIKFYARILLLVMIFQIVTPALSFALTDGPKSPEFSKFEPVAATDMVNHFSGDFMYNLPVLNVPGPDGAGYTLSLSYKSGASAEQEASWVGHGWTLNPGAINRNMRGIPDDYKGVDIIRYNKTDPNWTASASARVGDLEIFGFDVQASAGTSLRINSSQGFQRSFTFGLSYQGLVNLNMAVNAQGNTFSANLNPIKYLQKLQNEAKAKENSESKKNDVKSASDAQLEIDLYSIDLTVSKLESKLMGSAQTITTTSTSSFGIFSFSEVVRNTTFSKYKGNGYNRTGSLQVNPAVYPIGGEIGFNSHFNYQFNDPLVVYEANGYMNNLTSDDYPTKGEVELNLLQLLANPDASIQKNTISDYYVEREEPYQKRDYTLGIPFSSPDNFMVTGEGIIGGFQYHQSRPGHFYPSMGTSYTSSDNRGLEFMLGSNVGVGLDIGLGGQAFYSTRWDSEGNTSVYQFDNEGHFRFNHDLGGTVSLSERTNTQAAKLLIGPGFKMGPFVPENFWPEPKNEVENFQGQSNYIQYHTLEDIADGNRFDQESQVLDRLVQEYQQEKGKVTNPKTVCEFNIMKDNGSAYTFGIPVFTSDEVGLQLDADISSRGACPDNDYTDCTLENHLIFQDLNYNNFPEIDLSEHKLVVGDVKKEPYANLFLLTQITDKDFIDRRNDGPDPSDFGAWTKFHYLNHYDLQDPYRWRTPYSGMIFSKNRISDTRDDVASIFTGNKEIYTLKCIETKSHLALFITNKSRPEDFEDIFPDGLPDNFFPNTLAPRKDGLDATSTFIAEDPHADQVDYKGNKELVYLDRIILLSKNRPERPISTTRFAYDYSLIKGLPNNLSSSYPFNSGRDYLQSGKLTLKKVWFEYEGTKPTRISPYQFHYEYPSEFPVRLTEKYPWLSNFNKGLSAQDQNPDYHPFLLDAWGNYHLEGRERKRDLLPWPSQNISSRSKFDPAAWQLKRINLPSGGEILVDYESKDYQYVQNRRAMAMAKLQTQNVGDNEYYIDVSDLGIDPTNQDQVNQLKEACENYFLNGKTGKEKMYFKFLFSFVGSEPTLDNCDSEYITGYADAQEFSIEPSGNEFLFKVKLNPRDDVTPRKGCYDFYTTQRFGFEGKILGTANRNETYDCGLSIPDIGPLGSINILDVDELTQTITENHDSNQSSINVHSGELLGTIEGKVLTGEYGIPSFGSLCQVIRPELSYLKLPMITPKRGGGVRVKRLLLYDPGIESNDEAIYGTEYHYVNENGSSSGIATNEPSVMREENALVTFLPREDQGWYSRLTVGADKKQTEGPLGESLLPAPSVGHSRVEVRNIHEGKTGVGFQVFEYYTAKDRPFDKFYNIDPKNDITIGDAIQHTQLSDNKNEVDITIPAVLFNYSVSSFVAGQGFRFIINNMHGQPRGEYTFGQSEEGKYFLSSGKTYNYFEAGEKLLLRSPSGEFMEGNPGKEMDIAMEMKSLYNNSLDFSVELDVSISLSLPLFISLTAIPTISISENTISTHLTSKVVRYPAIVKSIETAVDGTCQLTEYLAFDQYTGQPILTRTTDEYDRVTINNEQWDGSIFTYQIPASHIYPEMGPRYLNELNTQQLYEIAATYSTYGKEGNPIEAEDGILQNVLSANVQTYSNHEAWFKQAGLIENYGLGDPDYEKLTRVWRPYRSFLFKTDRQSYEDLSPIYQSGFFKDFTPFDNWRNLDTTPQDGWLKMTEITKYAPHGQVLEEVDILGRHYSMKYTDSYNHVVPSIRAANAKYNNIAFQDFEYALPGPGTNQVKQGHSGKFGFRISANQEETTLPDLPLGTLIYTEDIQTSKGAWIKVWVKNDEGTSPLYIRINNSRQSSSELQKVASTGEWSLYRTLLSPQDFEDKSFLNIGSRITLQLATERNITIDDLRFQPYDAQASCYVYDRETFRLLTQFDDQHFGMYYKYNQEGQLIIKQIETERGMKTLQETQYNTPKIIQSQ